MVAGFIASLKVAVTMVLGQAPLAPFGGTAAATVGGVSPGIGAAFLSGSLHPALKIKMSSRNAENQTLGWL
jgi:hypothetical protein